MFPNGHILREIKCMGQNVWAREQLVAASSSRKAAPTTGFVRLPPVHLAPFLGFAFSFVRGSRRASKIELPVLLCANAMGVGRIYLGCEY